MNLLKRLIKKRGQQFDGSKRSLCINCGRFGTQHYLVKTAGRFRYHCPTKVEMQYHGNQYFERGTNLEYLQRVYEKRHGL